MSSIPMGEILKLSPQKRLEIVEEIWDSLANDPASVPVPVAHLKELKKRNAAYIADPEGSTVPWSVVREQARKKLGG